MARRTVCGSAIMLLAAATVFGALQLEFLCDDAFITFRYVSNARDGIGLVWNPPPFAPVEGYTSLSWALLLWAVWSCFGVEPPQSANWLSIGFGLGLFVVTATAALRIRDRDGKLLPLVAVLATLLVVAGNRTFLTWMTGGLETALFNFAFVGWVVLAFRRPERRTTGWLATWATAATIAALTRPDGLLLAVATAAAAAWSLPHPVWRRALIGLLPLLLVLAHVAWRRVFYGEWLPNTWFAKVTSPWPEAGCRYLACFLFEHGAWAWLPIAAVWAAVARWRLAAHVPAATAVTVVLAHVGYYVVRVGGDPFEYRILSQLVPLGALATAAMAAWLRPGGALALAGAIVVGGASSFGWVHLAASEPDLTPFYRPIAPKMPRWLQPLVHWHDRNQAWLQVQVLCGRRDLHAMFLAAQQAELPERRRTTIDPQDLPVAPLGGVGLAGWVLPDYAVLDLLGLNDWVIARTPVTTRAASLLPKPLLDAVLAGDANGDGRCTRAELRLAIGGTPGASAGHVDGLVGLLLLLFADHDPEALDRVELARIEPFFTGMRLMAHQRQAPAEYVQALDPNVTIVDRAVVVRPRAVPLTPARVRAIEAEWRNRTRRPGGG